MQSSLRRAGIAEQQSRWQRAAGRNPGRLDADRCGGGRGRVIPHAGRLDAPTLAAGPLAIAVVEPTFGTQTMAPASAP